MSEPLHGSHGPCPELEDLSALLDGELDAARAAEVRAHAASCARCGPALARLERAAAAVRALPREEASPELVRRVVAGARPRNSWRIVTKLAMAAGLLLGGALMITVVTQQQAERDALEPAALARPEPQRSAAKAAAAPLEQESTVADGAGSAAGMAEVAQAPPSMEKLAAGEESRRDLDDSTASRARVDVALEEEQPRREVAAAAAPAAPPPPAITAADSVMTPSDSGARQQQALEANEPVAAPASIAPAGAAPAHGEKNAELFAAANATGEADVADLGKSRDAAKDKKLGADAPTACAVLLRVERSKRDAAPETRARIVSDPVVQVPLAPADSRSLHRVNARVLVDGTRGTACEVDVASLAGPQREIVDRAVRDAVATWTFVPALRSGAPVPSVLDLSVTLEPNL